MVGHVLELWRVVVDVCGGDGRVAFVGRQSVFGCSFRRCSLLEVRRGGRVLTMYVDGHRQKGVLLQIDSGEQYVDVERRREEIRLVVVCARRASSSFLRAERLNWPIAAIDWPLCKTGKLALLLRWRKRRGR